MMLRDEINKLLDRGLWRLRSRIERSQNGKKIKGKHGRAERSEVTGSFGDRGKIRNTVKNPPSYGNQHGCASVSAHDI
jgi:hypothetical protein